MDDPLMKRFAKLQSAIDPSVSGDHKQLERLMVQCRRRVKAGKPPVNAVNVFWAYIRLGEDHELMGFAGAAAHVRELGQDHYFRLGGPTIPRDHPIAYWAMEQTLSKVMREWINSAKDRAGKE
jgi:hypothetical protein